MATTPAPTTKQYPDGILERNPIWVIKVRPQLALHHIILERQLCCKSLNLLIKRNEGLVELIDRLELSLNTEVELNLRLGT